MGWGENLEELPYLLFVVCLRVMGSGGAHCGVPSAGNRKGVIRKHAADRIRQRRPVFAGIQHEGKNQDRLLWKILSGADRGKKTGGTCGFSGKTGQQGNVRAVPRGAPRNMPCAAKRLCLHPAPPDKFLLLQGRGSRSAMTGSWKGSLRQSLRHISLMWCIFSTWDRKTPDGAFRSSDGILPQAQAPQAPACPTCHDKMYKGQRADSNRRTGDLFQNSGFLYGRPARRDSRTLLEQVVQPLYRIISLT